MTAATKTTKSTCTACGRHSSTVVNRRCQSCRAKLWVVCDSCGKLHEAEASHEGRFGEGTIYAVICPVDDYLTDYYTAERLA